MAEERIDIKVTDSGSDKAAKGLRAIASEAMKAQKALDQISSGLGSIPSRQIDEMGRAASRSSSSVSQLDSHVKEYAKASKQAAAHAADMAARTAALRASVDPLGASIDRVNKEIQEANILFARGKISQAEYAASTATLTARLDGLRAAQARGTQGSKAMTQATLNLSRQFADIGVTAAMGMNPLMILIQQGPQIADAFQMAKTQGLGFGSVLRGMVGQVGALAAAMAPLLVVAGAVGAAFYGMHKKMSESYPKDVTEGMGLTEEQLKKVENRAVTFGDTVAGVMQTLGEDIKNGPLGTFAAHFAEESQKAAVAFFENMRWGVAGVIAFTRAGMKTVDDTFRNTASNMAKTMPGAYNVVAFAFTKFINHQLSGIRLLVKALNMIPGIDIPEPELKMPSAENMAQAGATSGKTFSEYFKEEVESEIESQNDFIARSTQNAIENARKRIREQAGDASEGRTRTGRRTGRTEEEKREEALRRVNAQLDGEISRMGMLKREREAAQRFDQINEQLLRQRIVLTDEETASIKNKIAQVQELAEIQSEMDRIYDDLNGAEERYTATVNALNTMLDKGSISYEQYIRQTNKALDAYKESTDPLRELSKEQAALARTLGKYGDELQRHNYYERIRQDLAKEGIYLSPQYVEGEDAKTDALMRGNAELQRRLALQAAINNTTAPYIPPSQPQSNTYGDIMRNSEAMYEELERQRAEGLVSEKNYNEQIKALDRALYNARLGFANEFFGNLASLTSSGNRELAAIGKAAAVTQATIDGYLAIQKALAAYPPPWNYAMAASVGVATAANIAGIMSTNVGNFATGGQIMVGGRDGVDKNNINMNVTKGERITIETPAQQKATDEAIARGQSGGGGDVKVSNINVVDPRFVIDSMDTAAGSRVIKNIITANKREINAILGSR